MSLPWVFNAFRLLGRLLASYIWPITQITLEVEQEDGSIETKVVKLSNTHELVKSINRARKVVR